MIDDILLAAEQSPFAAEHDRLQWAIASVLEPDSILQLVTRDHGSERALRDARPSAHYLAVEGAAAIESMPTACSTTSRWRSTTVSTCSSTTITSTAGRSSR